MEPGVRPQTPPNYDGYVYVYVFTQILTPWTQPPVNGQVTLVVANSQGFVGGMSVAIDDGAGNLAGYYTVVSTTALDRMTVSSLGGQPPGTGFSPGKITTTSLPGPIGPVGPQGSPGASGAQGNPGPPLTPKGSVATQSSLPSIGVVGDMWVAQDTGHAWGWNGNQWVDLGAYQGPVGPQGPQGPNGPQGIQGVPGPVGPQGIQGTQGFLGNPGENAFSTTTAVFTVPPIGGNVVVTVADPDFMTIGEYVYVAGSNGSGQAGALQITAIAGNQVTLFNPPSSAGAGIGEAPTDGNLYGRQNASWSIVPTPGPAAPFDPQTGLYIYDPFMYGFYTAATVPPNFVVGSYGSGSVTFGAGGGWGFSGTQNGQGMAAVFISTVVNTSASFGYGCIGASFNSIFWNKQAPLTLKFRAGMNLAAAPATGNGFLWRVGFWNQAQAMGTQDPFVSTPYWACFLEYSPDQNGGVFRLGYSFGANPASPANTAVTYVNCTSGTPTWNNLDWYEIDIAVNGTITCKLNGTTILSSATLNPAGSYGAMLNPYVGLHKTAAASPSVYAYVDDLYLYLPYSR